MAKSTESGLDKHNGTVNIDAPTEVLLEEYRKQGDVFPLESLIYSRIAEVKAQAVQEAKEKWEKERYDNLQHYFDEGVKQGVSDTLGKVREWVKENKFEMVNGNEVVHITDLDNFIEGL